MTRDGARSLPRLALELRPRVRVQPHEISLREFPLTEFSCHDRETGLPEVVRLE